MSMEPLVDLSQFASALIIKPSSLGDIVHTLPAVHAIKKAYPHLQLRWLTNPEWMPLLDGNDDITEVIPFPRKQFRGISSFPLLLSWARQFNAMPRELPELALDFQGLLRSALLSVARGAEPVIGLSDAREGASKLYRHVVGVNAEDHAVDRYLQMPRALGVEMRAGEVEFPLPEGKAPDGMVPPKNYILLHPCSRGEGKSLKHEVIQALCDCLAPHPMVVVGQSEEARTINGSHVISLVNQTGLLELIWLIRNARGCISADSGPMHIASGITDFTLAIHTWSNPRKVGPYNHRAWVWKAGRIAHCADHSDDEVAVDQPFETSDARRMADFILQEWL